MAVIAHVTLRGVSPEQYDKVRELCGWLDEPPTGGLGHLTWFEDGVNYNVDAWEDEAALEAFATERLGPAMAQAGVDSVPEIAIQPAHEVFLPKALTIT